MYATQRAPAVDSSAKTVRELAAIVGGELLRGDPSALVRRVMPTGEALEDAVTFVTKQKYLPTLATTRAAAVMLAPDMLAKDGVTIPSRTAVIRVERPYVAFARAAQVFAAKVPAPVGVHASAVIDPDARIGAEVAIGPFAYVARGAVIEDGVVLYPGVHVEEGARVGAGSVLYNHVVIRHGCVVGARCIVHPGAVIGSDGFGFAQDQDPGEASAKTHVKIPQLGIVEVGEDVEIGANCCVDRATLGTTRISAGTKIDNLVQIGHNVEIGPGCIIVAQSGIAGSSKLGKGVILAAQSGVSGHLELGDGAVVYGQSGIADDVPAGERVMGSPAVSQSEHIRSLIRLRKLDSLFSRVKKLERLLRGTDE
jgi:UDP-3-O-[3-hydroxymyristoyl] glucosamine N-acyltransferase